MTDAGHPAVVPVRDDRGIGTIGTAAAFLVFLLLMFSAVQILFDLYATSMVTAAAHDAAVEVAGFGAAADRCAAAHAAGATLAERLGGYADAGRVSLEWTCADPDVVRVRVTATHPSILPARLGGLFALSGIDRTIEVRVERRR